MITSAIGKYSAFLVQFILMLIYARLFSIDNFGILASLQVFLLFFNVIGVAGIGPAIINIDDDQITKTSINTLYFSFIASFLVSISFQVFVLIFLSDFLDITNLEHYSIPISIGVFFSVLTTVPLALMQRKRKFIAIGTIEVISEILSFAVVIYLFSLNFGIWALLSKSITSPLVKFLCSIVCCEELSVKNISNHRKLEFPRIIYSASKYQLKFEVFNYLSRNLDTILVSKYFGSTTVGIYDRGFNLLRYPLLVLNSAISPAVQPVISESKQHLQKLVEIHIKYSVGLLILSSFFMLAFFFESESIVSVLLGENWLEVAPIIKMLSLTIPVQVLGAFTSGFYQGTDNFKLLWRVGIVTGLIKVLTIIVFVQYKDIAILVEAIVYSTLLCSIFNYYTLYCHAFKVSIKKFAKKLLIGSFAVVLTSIVYLLLSNSIKIESNFIDLFTKCTILLILTLCTLIATLTLDKRKDENT
jgi:PST family polysaccharide transporter